MISSIFIGMGVTMLYLVYSFLKSSSSDDFLENEARNIVENDAEVDETYTSKGRVYTRGLSVTKDNDTNKYKTVPQAKVCDIGFS